MATARQLPRALTARGVPWRTRWSLLAIAARRRLRPVPVYHVRVGAAKVPITHDDYGVDWETMRTIVVDRAYELDYRSAVVVDIGAHKGCFGAYALERGARAVVSYEPERANFGLLERCAADCRRAGLDWRTRRAAVGREAGEADLHVMESSWGHALKPSELAEDEIGVQRVPVVAVAEVLDEALRLAVGAPVVVKVNAEGAECEIILETDVSAWMPVAEVLVEVHSWAPCTANDLVAHLEGAGLRSAPVRTVDWVHRLSRSAAPA